MKSRLHILILGNCLAWCSFIFFLLGYDFAALCCFIVGMAVFMFNLFPAAPTTPDINDEILREREAWLHHDILRRQRRARADRKWRESFGNAVPKPKPHKEL
jgi:hypothetical protein